MGARVHFTHEDDGLSLPWHGVVFVTLEAFRTGIRYAGRPDLSNYLLAKGIRPESNMCPGDPGEVADGEIDAHLGNPGS